MSRVRSAHPEHLRAGSALIELAVPRPRAEVLAAAFLCNNGRLRNALVLVNYLGGDRLR
jgi:hypothetical protein